MKEGVDLLINGTVHVDFTTPTLAIAARTVTGANATKGIRWAAVITGENRLGWIIGNAARYFLLGATLSGHLV